MKRYKAILLPAFYLTDLLIVYGIFILSYYLRYNTFDWIGSEYSNLLIAVTVIWLVFSLGFQSFREKRGRNFSWHLNRLFLTEFGFLLGLFGYIVITRDHQLSRAFLGIFVGLQFTMLLLAHMLRHFLMVQYRSAGHNFKNVLVLGEPGDNAHMVEWSRLNPQYGYRIKNSINCYNDDCAGQLVSTIQTDEYDELLILSPEMLAHDIDEIVDIAEDKGLRVLVAPTYVKSFGNRAVMDQMNGTPVIRVRREPLRKLSSRLLKRAFDLIVSTLFVVFFYWWIYLIIGLAIKLNSRGPIIFKQKRMGRDSKEFECFKFRTMRQDKNNQKEAEKGFSKITSKNDSRITKVGRALRKTNLDELPQVLNVLLGDMSIVGPRPLPLGEDLLVQKKINKYRIRQFAPPGLTGWAQVNGYRGGTTDMDKMQTRINYDIWYIEHWSLLLDIKIVLITFWQMLTFNTGAH